jgi:hypothetical protein
VRFLELLREELARRRAANRCYSLRAFARHLRVDHATLSQTMRGRRRLTPRAVGRLGARLGLSRAAIDAICAATNDGVVLAFVGHPSFRPDSRWIAIRLGLPLDDVNMSLQRLLRGGALLMQSRDRWTRSGG